MKQWVLFLSILFFNQFLWSQKKFETEMRIDKKSVPESAQTFVKELNFSSKIKWYQEFGLLSYSYEAKTKFKGKKYSIEFDSKGKLEDVEIVISKDEINLATLKKIESKFSQDLSKYRIRKIQIQYSGNNKAIREKIVKDTNSKDLTTNYEIVVSAKVKKKFKKFEYLFNSSGEYIQRKIVVLINTDNLEY